jgi:hypothetical protein
MLVRRDLIHPELLRVTLFLPSPPHARKKIYKNSRNIISWERNRAFPIPIP